MCTIKFRAHSWPKNQYLGSIFLKLASNNGWTLMTSESYNSRPYLLCVRGIFVFENRKVIYFSEFNIGPATRKIKILIYQNCPEIRTYTENLARTEISSELFS